MEVMWPKVGEARAESPAEEVKGGVASAVKEGRGSGAERGATESERRTRTSTTHSTLPSRLIELGREAGGVRRNC